MGGIEFQDENGKWRSVALEGGVIPFGEDSDVEAFERWRDTDEGKEWFGIDAVDEDSEHYLSDKYPWNPETEMRGDEDDYIDWCYYEKCRYGCYRHFWYSGKHDCCICGVISCKQCARDGGRTCSTKDCSAWICGNHNLKTRLCPNCADDEEDDEDEGDRKPPAKKPKASNKK